MAIFAILGDTHFGARRDDQNIAQNQRLFFDSVFWPYMDQHGLCSIITTGDTFDTPGHLTSKAWMMYKDCLGDPNRKSGWSLETFMLVGNHDLAQKNSVSNSTLEMVVTNDVNMISAPFHYEDFYSVGLIVPWICQDNQEVIFDKIRQFADFKTDKKKFIVGHFELSGFEMSKGNIINHGHSPDLFKGIDLVLSGHYHTKSVKGNIVYVGTPYQLTWHDADDDKGFHIFNTETFELTFVSNPHILFKRIRITEENVKEPVDVGTAHFVELTVDRGVKSSDVKRIIETYLSGKEVSVIDVSLDHVSESKASASVALDGNSVSSVGIDKLVQDTVQSLELNEEMSQKVMALLNSLRATVLAK